jgi:hypothetical protein
MRGNVPFVRAGIIGTCSVIGAVGFTSSSAWGQCSQHNGNNGTICCQQTGPDVIVGVITGPSSYAADGTYDAFSFGTTSCNIGNQNVHWNAFPSTTHPAIAQGMFKMKNGRFEQIGMSWLKHGFTALTNNDCGCGCNGSGGSVLGVGCADPYTAARNGTQSDLKPRWYVNAHTGVFPSSQPVASGSGTTYRRLRVKLAELEPSSASVRYFAECQYVTQDDAYFNNEDNNCSYVEISMSGASDYTASITSTTQREKPAIRAWKAADSTVTETNLQIPEPAPTSTGGSCSPTPCTIPPVSSNTSALVIVSSKATSLGGGMWHYEYAVQNVNCDKSIGAFSIPLPTGATVSNIGFHDVEYHSGDGTNNVNYDGTDWPATVSNMVRWACVTPYNAGNDTGNAIRWGTLYNFRFDCNRPPARVAGNSLATLETYKATGSYNGLAWVPDYDCNNNGIGDSYDIFNGTSPDANSNGIPDECETPQSCQGDVAQPPNGYINNDDLFVVIGNWGPCAGCPADCFPAGGNGFVNIDDLFWVINHWGPCQ